MLSVECQRIQIWSLPVTAHHGGRTDQQLSGLPGGNRLIVFIDDGLTTTPDVYNIQVSWTEVGQANPVTYQLRLEI